MIVEIAAFAVDDSEWAWNGERATGDAAVPARHAATRMRKATRFRHAKRRGALTVEGNADPGSKSSLMGRGERSIEAVRDLPGLQLSRRQVARLEAVICGMLSAERHA